MSGEAAVLAFDELIAAPRARQADRLAWLVEHGIVPADRFDPNPTDQRAA